MDMHWLDDVLVLLEEGNMTRAAMRRNVTQPAFSRRIRSFEDWLGVKVLDRGKNRIDISPALAGNEEEIRALVARIADLRGKIAHFDAKSTTVSIAAQHAPVFSTFPDMALRAKRRFPGLKFQLHAGNLDECLTMFLRGDASMLLCYEAENASAMPFGPTISRALWGLDYLVPVVGGALRYSVKDDNTIAMDTPAVVYPDNSYFGEVLNAGGKTFGTRRFSETYVCETPFSSGMRELVLKGLGVGWLPFSMAYREIESGQLISLANHFGRVKLEVAIYADCESAMSAELLETWNGGKR